MRRRCLSLGVLLAVASLAGCGGSSSSGSSSSSAVSPAAYVKSICSAIAPYEAEVKARSNALNLSTIKSPQQGKTALQDFLTAVAGDTDHAVSQLKAAGVPQVTNGKAIANGIVNAFSTLQGALSQAASRASTLPTNNAQAFKTSAEALGTQVKGSMNSIGSSLNGLKSQELETAAAKEPTCKQLASG